MTWKHILPQPEYLPQLNCNFYGIVSVHKVGYFADRPRTLPMQFLALRAAKHAIFIGCSCKTEVLQEPLKTNTFYFQ